MSIDYFLQSKHIYKQIEYNLKEIIELYKEFIELTESQENIVKYSKEQDIQFLIKTKEEYNEKVKNIGFFKDFIKQKMMDCCQHNFVKDEIDISPEKSQQIEYCSICDFTK